MTKHDFINRMAEMHSITKKESELIVDRFNSTLTDCLAIGEEVSFSNMYKFGVKQMKARIGADPRNQMPIQIKGRKVPYCRFGKGLKEVVEKL